MTDLIIGWPGQDAIYLALALSEDNIPVHLMGRNVLYTNSSRPHTFDSSNQDQVVDLISTYAYDRIFFFQAYHAPSASRVTSANLSDSFRINTLLVCSVLDAIALSSSYKPSEIVYASSRLSLPKSHLGRDSQRTNSIPHIGLCEQSAYSISKYSAELVLQAFSAEFSVRTTVLNLFNHESIYRRRDFLLPRFFDRCFALAQSSNLNPEDEALFRLNASNLVDIGSAEEFMRSVLSLIANQSRPLFQRYQLATGHQVPFFEILSGVASVFPRLVDGDPLFFHDPSLARMPDHPKADLSKISLYTYDLPVLHGQALGQALGRSYLSNRPNPSELLGLIIR